MRNLLKLSLFTFLAFSVFTACKQNEVSYPDPSIQFAKDTAAIKKYIADSIPAVMHESGVFYVRKSVGGGDGNYSNSSQVEIKYTGKIMGSATPFDSGTHTFYLGQLIPGMQIGIPLVREGGKIRILIPSYWGYGVRGSGSIPPNSILDFEVEVIDIKN